MRSRASTTSTERPACALGGGGEAGGTGADDEDVDLGRLLRTSRGTITSSAVIPRNVADSGRDTNTVMSPWLIDRARRN